MKKTIALLALLVWVKAPAALAADGGSGSKIVGMHVNQHGYENAWMWPELQPTLRQLKSPGLDAVIDTQLSIESAPPKEWTGTGYEFTHRSLRETESYTPRLLVAMKQALAGK